jgi:hypothetical protein
LPVRLPPYFTWVSVLQSIRIVYLACLINIRFVFKTAQKNQLIMFGSWHTLNSFAELQ